MQKSDIQGLSRSAAPEGRDGEVTLVIGRRTPLVGGVSPSGKIETVDWVDLDELLLTIVDPDLVVSPVVSDEFDCVDLAFRLTRLGYKGRYLALTDALPHPAIVRREVRSLCPFLDFDIMETSRSRDRLQ